MAVKLLLFVFVFTLSVCLTHGAMIARRSAEEKPTSKQPIDAGKNGSPPAAVTQMTTASKPETAQDSKNGTDKNTTETQSDGGFVKNMITNNKGMLLRTFYVLIGVTMIVLLYFGVRAWRTRRRRNKSRKYGIITSRGSDLEMEPLDRDMDEDDDMTVFEMNGKPK